MVWGTVFVKLLLWQYVCCDELAHMHLSLLIIIGVAVFGALSKAS
jgi:hypothetical protein